MKLKQFFGTGMMLFLGLLTLASCAQNSSHLVAPVEAFIQEQDEPAARGKVQLISPQESNILFRFDISPDNKYIVYSGTQAGGGDNLFQLWRIEIEGSLTPQKITSGGDSDYFTPTFTKDGEYIVFESGNQLWKVKKDGTGGKVRIPGAGMRTDSSPHVSSKDKLVFNSTIGTMSSYKEVIWISNLDGGELTQLREGTKPRWSPDGNEIVFEHQGDIWKINVDGTQLTQLTTTSLVFEDTPSYSPDGRQIVYSSNEGKDGRAYNDWNIWKMDIDGSNKTQLTELQSWDMWPIWGKSGIYFLSSRGASSNQRVQKIWRLKP